MLTNKRVLTALSGCVLALGCSAGMDAPSDSENAGSAEEALTAACGTFPAQFTYLHNLSADLISNGYSHGCDGNSIIFDINSFSSAFFPPTLTPNTAPNNPTDCANTSLRYYVWEKTSTSSIFLGLRTATGAWNPGDGGFIPAECEFGGTLALGISSPVALQSGRDYRFGVSARYNGSPIPLHVYQVGVPR